MELQCEKCDGTAVLAAQMRSFEHKGRNLSCLVFVSSCVVCGHRWEDATHEAENMLRVKQACAADAARQ
jgi:hypothetical protein